MANSGYKLSKLLLLLSLQLLLYSDNSLRDMAEPRDTCPTEGWGGHVLAPMSSWEWRRLGLLSVECFPEPSGV